MSVDICDRVFDAYTGEMGQLFMRETQRRIHWMCAAANAQSILDVGCSQGLVPILLGREGRDAIGIDSNATAIKSADEHLAAEQVGVRRRVSFIQADFVSHDFGNVHFDCIIMGEVLEHLLEPERFIAKAASLLKPGGKLIVTVPFGINDHADHKQTFYLLEPLRLLSEHFRCQDVSILGKWLGLVGIRSEPDASERPAPSAQALRSAEDAFALIERELRDNVTSLRTRLDDANTKYRSSTEDVARLKREVAHHESERKGAERAREEITTELRQLRERASSPAVNAAMGAELANEVRARHTSELELARLQERLAVAERVAKLELELKLREGEIAKLSELKSELARRIEALESRIKEQAPQLELAKSQAQALAQLELDLAAMATKLRHSEELRRTSEIELKNSTGESTRLLRQLAETQTHLKQLEGTLSEARGRVEQQQLQLTELEAALLATRAEQARLIAQAELTEREREQERTEKERAEWERERQRTEKERAEWEREREREREHERTERAREPGTAPAQGSLREAQRRIAQLEVQLQAARRNERRSAAQLEQEQRRRAAAQRTADQTKKTLSFQLGYELIHGFKSPQRLLRLPKSLWQLQQEASRRRSEKEHAPPPTALPSATKASASIGAAVTSAAGLAKSASAVIIPRKLTPASPAAAPVSARADRAAAVVTQLAPTAVPGAVPPAELHGNMAALRVACINDEFTFSSFSPECVLKQLTPQGFREELEEFQPQLLFIESAWRGKGDLWDRKVAYRGQELTGIVEWCRSRGIPTVFWNKEDPVHFRTFLNTAKMFDVVFTTDMDCIHRYKRALGHERVYLLPFALQPALHNPLEKYDRKRAVCFAGAYYTRYPERQADLASFVESLATTPGFEIYDRNLGKSNPDYQFPETYRPYIVGTLLFNEIDKAYKGYRYALNLNSIKTSQSMFARRVYELLGSNTITLSNFSRGVRLMFGDLVITTDHGEHAASELRKLANDEARSRRFRLAGLRKVLSEHTYGHRLRFIAECVWNVKVSDALPIVAVVASAASSADVERVLANFERQAYPNKQLILVVPAALELGSLGAGMALTCLRREQAEQLKLADALGRATHVASLAVSDYWGKHFLVDLALATRYSTAQAIGKSSRYFHGSGGVELTLDGQQYRAVPNLPARAALLQKGVVAGVGLLDWLDKLEVRLVDPASCLAIDEFNYCQNGAAASREALRAVDDLEGLDHGVSMARFLEADDAPLELEKPTTRARQLEAASLSRLFKSSKTKPITVELQGDQLLIQSALPDQVHEYLYASEACSLRELGFPESGKFHLDVTPGLNVQLAFVFWDENKKRVGNKVCQAGTNETVQLPEGVASVQLGLRVYGAGTAQVNALVLDHVQEAPDRLLGRSDVLLITNHYPSTQDLYRNGFVHRRVLEYRKGAARVDVFRLRNGEKPSYYEFDGVDVISGGKDSLVTLLRSNHYRVILVHFLDQQLWSVLREHLPTTRVLIWVHGAEIQAWHRRASHYATPEQLAAAQAETETRSRFWRGVARELPRGSKLVFVSQQFAREVMTDLDLTLADDRFEVIHNVIDTSLFSYQAKAAAQRTHILSVRPYTSRIYGNDLAVAAILELKTKPYFNELDFHLIGDGPLFEETTAPLQNLSNVRLERRFLTQQEIAALHKNYGIFLCPSRGDTQGVSRDEAMSSGLVPVTNAVGAIPEFVDADSGILAEREDHVGLAQGIARLYEDRALFLRLSATAAQRVRGQSGPPQTTERELRLFATGDAKDNA